MCHAHVQHHKPPGEVQEKVTALGAVMGARREPCRTGGADGVGGGRRAGGCVSRPVLGGLMQWLSISTPTLRGDGAMAGDAVANATPGAAAAVATVGAADAMASPVMSVR